MHARWAAATAIVGLTVGMEIAAPRWAAAEDARQILSRSLDPDDTTYVGEQVTVISGLPVRLRPQSREQVFRKGNIVRTNYANGRVVFDDGKVQLRYLPRQAIVEKHDSALNPAVVEKQRRALGRGLIDVSLVGEDEVAGRKTYVLIVKPPRGGERKIWVDKENYLQLRQDVSNPNGRTISTYFTRIDFQAEPPPAMTAFVPPAGVEVVEAGRGRPLPVGQASQLAQAWGGILAPKALPAGYRFRAFYRHMFNGRPVLVSVYDGPGNNTFSLFQGPSMGMSGMRENRPKLNVLTSSKGRADVMIVGPLKEDELQRVMDSVAPQ